MAVLTRMLRDLRAADLAEVGGKAANLGELIHAGLPVPPGFCVTTGSYQAFVAHNHLNGVVRTALAARRGVAPSNDATASSAIQTAFLQGEIPEALRTAIVSAYVALERADSAGVSVRSSATAEDLPGNSFAGQQDTYLNVGGADEVLDAIRRCWASLWTARAIAYRDSRDFEHLDVHLAVVVQQMFDSTASGVLFTANPTTSNPFQCVVNSSWGLGEAVVSGHVNPDQFVVDKADLSIIHTVIGDKSHMTVGGSDGRGTVLGSTPAGLATEPSLSAEAVREVCRLGLRIEQHFGTPQDVEWGWRDGTFAVLQAREITGADLDFGHELETWKTSAALADMYDERWLWSRAYSDDVQTGPSTPSFYTYLQAGMTAIRVTALQLAGCDEFLGYPAERFEDIPFFRWFGARAYYNLDVERERIRRFIPPFARDDAALWPFPEVQRDEVRNQPFDWPEFWQLLLTLHRDRYDVSLLGTTAVVYENLERWTDEEAAFWERIDLEQADVQEIFEAQRASRLGSRFGENVALPFTIYLFVLPQALKALCSSWLDDDGTLADLLLTGIHSKTSEENERLWDLSRCVRSSRALLDAFDGMSDHEALARLQAASSREHDRFLALLEEFVGEHHQRGGAERDAYYPRWGDDPALVFRSLRPMLALGDDESPQARERAAAIRVREARDAARARLSDGSDGGVRAAFFDWFVDLVRDYAYYRDFERFFNDRTMSRSRRLYEAIGRRFVAKGMLDDPEDVFFLGRPEMLQADQGGLSAAEIAVRVRMRRAVYSRYTHREPPKYIRGWTFFDDDSLEAGQLRGIGASGGVVTGRARVCRDLSEISSIRKGDILVAVATDPGWTSVFAFLSGVIVETGGVVAHAVMIAREYGLPCVSNVPQACDLIPDGALVTLDGRTGHVRIETGNREPTQPDPAVQLISTRDHEFAVSAAGLWDVISDFGGIGEWWPGGFASVSTVGPAGAGKQRTLTRHDGSQVIETLVSISVPQHTLVLRVDAGLPAPIRSYTCGYSVQESEDGCCTLRWSPAAEVDPGSEQVYRTVIERGWTALVTGLETAIGRQTGEFAESAG